MTAELIAVGTELLLGDIVNTNAAFLSRELAKLGINVFTQTVVGDNKQRLHLAIDHAFGRGADVLIICGGLGPTEDDITKEALAEFWGIEMVFHEPTWKKVEIIFQNSGTRCPSNNRKQAMILEGSHVFNNPNGIAPGLCVTSSSKDYNGRFVILMPGPPNELIPMFQEEVEPFLRQKSDKILVSKVLKIVGIGESMVEDKIKSLIESQDNPTVAPYAKTGEVWLRITASAASELAAYEKITPVVKALYDILGNAIYGEDNDTLEGVVAGLLRQHGYTLACAESCTGGMLTSKLINHPGISDVLYEGVVTYSNEAKTNRLQVSESLLQQYGAVSPEVAEAMAEGVALQSYDNSDDTMVGLSTTGIAGPGGGTPEKPVGLVYLGLYIPGQGTCSKKLLLTGDRNKIRTRAVNAALDFLRLSLIDINQET